MRLNGIELPPGTRWVNQHAWSPMDTALQRTVSGHAIHTQKKLKGGRPITLEFRPTDWPMLSYSDMINLKSILDTGNLMLFSADAEYLVIPFLQNGSGYEFSPVFDYQEQAMNYYTGKINLITV
jgi:hypothetical protein